MNALMSHLCPSATHMIRMDHAAVRDLYCKLTPQLSAGRREALTRAICSALEIHARVEEEVFYPALREAGVEPELLAKSEPEHEEMRAAIARVRGLQVTDPEHPTALAALMQGVLHHVADEEARVLPAAERLIPRQLPELGVRMTELKMQLAKPNMGRIALDTARGAPAKTALVLVGAVTASALLVGGVRSMQRHAPHHWR